MIYDLVAIVVIAVFYTAELSVLYLLGSIFLWMLLAAAARFFNIRSLILYFLVGAIIWFLMLKSGVHATIAGVLLAFAMPSSETEDDEESASYQLENLLHAPAAFVILPTFALCNIGIVIGADWEQNLTSSNSLGIIAGLVLGKPIGVALHSSASPKNPMKI